MNTKYRPGQKLKLKLPETNKSESSGTFTKAVRYCTVVRQFPHIVHLVYNITEKQQQSISLTPWEIEKARV